MANDQCVNPPLYPGDHPTLAALEGQRCAPWNGMAGVAPAPLRCQIFGDSPEDLGIGTWTVLSALRLVRQKLYILFI
jgi:hypothetical protein